jgi:hypothetical protein
MSSFRATKQAKINEGNSSVSLLGSLSVAGVEFPDVATGFDSRAWREANDLTQSLFTCHD